MPSSGGRIGSTVETNLEERQMPAYIVFTRESTRNASELATYSQKVGATLAGHPITVLAGHYSSWIS